MHLLTFLCKPRSPPLNLISALFKGTIPKVYFPLILTGSLNDSLVVLHKLSNPSMFVLVELQEVMGVGTYL